MIKENQRLLNTINVISDALLSILAVVTAFVTVFHLLAFERNFLLTDYIKLACIFIPVQLITYGCMGLYDSHRTITLSKELVKLVRTFFIDGLLVVAMLYIVKLFDFSRWTLAIFLVLDLVLVVIKRIILRQILRRFRTKGYNQKYVLIIGGGETASDYLKTIKAEKQIGLKCAGYLADSDSLDAERLGGFDDISQVLDSHSYDEAVCAGHERNAVSPEHCRGVRGNGHKDICDTRRIQIYVAYARYRYGRRNTRNEHTSYLA